jgi:hypothetical protein
LISVVLISVSASFYSVANPSEISVLSSQRAEEIALNFAQQRYPGSKFRVNIDFMHLGGISKHIYHVKLADFTAIPIRPLTVDVDACAQNFLASKIN